MFLPRPNIFQFFPLGGGSIEEAEDKMCASGKAPLLSPMKMWSLLSSGPGLIFSISLTSLDCVSSMVRWIVSSSGDVVLRPLILRHCEPISPVSSKDEEQQGDFLSNRGCHILFDELSPHAPRCRLPQARFVFRHGLSPRCMIFFCFSFGGYALYYVDADQISQECC